jgi:vacuolar-type H+-ATPase subunit F/Vma7
MRQTFVVGNTTLVEAFALIGVPGRTPPAGGAIMNWLAELVHAEKVQLLFLQTGLATQLTTSQLDELVRKYSCLVVEIPGSGEAAPDGSALRQLVEGAIGLTV